MSIRYAYTKEEAMEQLGLWKACLRALAEGHAKSYRVGTREFTAFDLKEVNKQIEFFADIVESMSGNVRTNRVARVVPRDL